MADCKSSMHCGQPVTIECAFIRAKAPPLKERGSPRLRVPRILAQDGRVGGFGGGCFVAKTLAPGPGPARTQQKRPCSPAAPPAQRCTGSPNTTTRWAAKLQGDVLSLGGSPERRDLYPIAYCLLVFVRCIAVFHLDWMLAVFKRSGDMHKPVVENFASPLKWLLNCSSARATPG
jgi:hypothetical protein